MAHIDIQDGIPGIVGAFAFRPETAKPMRELAEILLRGPSTLTSAEREAIAAFVSFRNDCRFCQLSHSAAAAEHRGGTDADYAWIEALKASPGTANVSPKMKALLNIAAKVQEGGKRVTQEEIAAARGQGATDLEIHDTVLIAAAFCMYNRYVDGLATWQPEDPAGYRPMGKRMAHEGYVRNAPEGNTVAAR
ncbi:MAG TPA: carboxymuconolactone decarboxylase family protein [Terracidiphilus sp.]|nr:carboxymuconolactone decarboxylase family protein [Terracidiphilus sp.]